MLPALGAGGATLRVGVAVEMEVGVDGEIDCRRDGVAGGGLKKSKTS
jgi:hypothetical protein